MSSDDPYIEMIDEQWQAYLVSHYGLILLTENEVAEIMDFIAQEQRELAVEIERTSP